MINALGEAMNQKTTNQYMIIEEKYSILKRYLQLLIKENRLDVYNVECILNALENVKSKEDE